MPTRSATRQDVTPTRRLKDPKGGLTAAGREWLHEKEGANLKPGVRGKADTPEKLRRKGSFLRRHFARPAMAPRPPGARCGSTRSGSGATVCGMEPAGGSVTVDVPGMKPPPLPPPSSAPPLPLKPSAPRLGASGAHHLRPGDAVQPEVAPLA